jgi:hypothetical protein
MKAIILNLQISKHRANFAPSCIIFNDIGATADEVGLVAKKVAGPSCGVWWEATMSLHQRQFVNPQLMKELQEIFDLAWQEIIALPDNDPEGEDDDLDSENAPQLRNELAQIIMSSRSLEPATIRETVLQEIRTGKLNWSRPATKAP